jgi:hypothetical protein
MASYPRIEGHLKPSADAATCTRDSHGQQWVDTCLLQRQARPVRRTHPPHLQRQDNRRSPRLPRRIDRRPRRITRQTRTRLHQPRLSRPQATLAHQYYSSVPLLVPPSAGLAASLHLSRTPISGQTGHRNGHLRCKDARHGQPGRKVAAGQRDGPQQARHNGAGRCQAAAVVLGMRQAPPSMNPRRDAALGATAAALPAS